MCTSTDAEVTACADEYGKIHVCIVLSFYFSALTSTCQIFDRLAKTLELVGDPPKSSRVTDMVFDYSGKHLITFRVDNSLRVSQVGKAAEEPPKRIVAGIQVIVDISPKHPVIAVAPYQDQVLLLDIMEGKVLQVFDTSGRAAFTPDGLGLVIQHPDSGDPMIWEFITAVDEASSFSLSPDGPRGQFVEVGRIQCPKSVRPQIAPLVLTTKSFL